MTNYYNEIEPFAVEWLKNLMDAGLIPNGDIDNRPIQEVKANDVKGYTQCHFFAGIGGWAYALQLAGVPTTKPLWTGSCPCQPFSSAGKRKGREDERHLWPHWHRLIRECKPTVIFGEQVESAVAFGWLDEVFDDLETEGYACGAAILPACSVGAPHRRNRLWLVAHAENNNDRRNTREFSKEDEWEKSQRQDDVCYSESGCPSIMGNAEHDGSFSAEIPGGNASAFNEWRKEGENMPVKLTGASESCDVADTSIQGFSARQQETLAETQRGGESQRFCEDIYRWIGCPDGKLRPVKHGLRLLDDGISSRMGGNRRKNRIGKIKGYGNAIVPEVAAEFIKAALV